ncbi:alpha/beta fold hydrolase [Georgenia thermotolerans]|nr:alpha/beta hydrolase [Georgenia thermotolerans]
MPQLEGVEHRFVDLSGVRVHVAEAGSGEPLVLLHGSPQHWWAWHPVLPRLAERYRVICPDQRGTGWSAAPRRGYTCDQIVADHVALLDALGLDSVDLVSHDLGAIPGFGLCYAHPDRVRRHVALGVPPFFARLDLRILPAFRHLWHQEVVALPGLGPAVMGRGRQPVARHMLEDFRVDPAALPPEDVEVFLAQFRDPARARATSATYRRTVISTVGHILRGTHRRTRLRTPTLVLVGSEDKVFSPEASARSLAGHQAYADHVELGTIDGAGHYVIEEQPDRLVDLVLDFLAKPLPA